MHKSPQDHDARDAARRQARADGYRVPGRLLTQPIVEIPVDAAGGWGLSQGGALHSAGARRHWYSDHVPSSASPCCSRQWFSRRAARHAATPPALLSAPHAPSGASLSLRIPCAVLQGEIVSLAASGAPHTATQASASNVRTDMLCSLQIPFLSVTPGRHPSRSRAAPAPSFPCGRALHSPTNHRPDPLGRKSPRRGTQNPRSLSCPLAIGAIELQ
ncbi:hypothetical protein T484DRAFT_1962455 [Baffinella frigidus]|nr:hypothetical protein T484DRAFT_1962455 [Cryptophyta sp. CCMP2293]